MFCIWCFFSSEVGAMLSTVFCNRSALGFHPLFLSAVISCMGNEFVAKPSFCYYYGNSKLQNTAFLHALICRWFCVTKPFSLALYCYLLYLIETAIGVVLVHKQVKLIYKACFTREYKMLHLFIFFWNEMHCLWHIAHSWVQSSKIKIEHF